MIKVIIAGHGGLPGNLLDTVENITGKIPDCEAICFNPGEGRREFRHKIGASLEKFGRREIFLFLTDVFGGSASNIGYSFVNEYNIKIVTGVNLPMLLTLASNRASDDIDDLSFKLIQAGKNSILIADTLLKDRRQRIRIKIMRIGKKCRWLKKISRFKTS